MLMSIFVKVCDILSGAVCKSAGVAGNITMQAINANDRTAIVDIIKNTI